MHTSDYGSETTRSGSMPGTIRLGSTLTLPLPASRALVLCFDGTGDQFDADVRRDAFGFYLLPGDSGLPAEHKYCAILRHP